MLMTRKILFATLIVALVLYGVWLSTWALAF